MFGIHQHRECKAAPKLKLRSVMVGKISSSAVEHLSKRERYVLSDMFKPCFNVLHTGSLGARDSLAQGVQIADCNNLLPSGFFGLSLFICHKTGARCAPRRVATARRFGRAARNQQALFLAFCELKSSLPTRQLHFRSSPFFVSGLTHLG